MFDVLSSRTLGVTKMINSLLSLEDCLDLKSLPYNGRSPKIGYL